MAASLSERLLLAEARAETAIRVAAEAMGMLTSEQLAELRKRLDALEGKGGDDRPDSGGNSKRPPG